MYKVSSIQYLISRQFPLGLYRYVEDIKDRMKSKKFHNIVYFQILKFFDEYLSTLFNSLISRKL